MPKLDNTPNVLIEYTWIETHINSEKKTFLVKSEVAEYIEQLEGMIKDYEKIVFTKK